MSISTADDDLKKTLVLCHDSFQTTLLGLLSAVEQLWCKQWQDCTRVVITYYGVGSAVDLFLSLMVNVELSGHQRAAAADLVSWIVRDGCCGLLVNLGNVVRALINCATRGSPEIKEPACRAIAQLVVDEDLKEEVMAKCKCSGALALVLAQGVDWSRCEVTTQVHVLSALSHLSEGPLGDKQWAQVLDVICGEVLQFSVDQEVLTLAVEVLQALTKRGTGATSLCLSQDNMQALTGQLQAWTQQHPHLMPLVPSLLRILRVEVCSASSSSKQEWLLTGAALLPDVLAHPELRAKCLNEVMDILYAMSQWPGGLAHLVTAPGLLPALVVNIREDTSGWEAAMEGLLDMLHTYISGAEDLEDGPVCASEVVALLLRSAGGPNQPQRDKALTVIALILQRVNSSVDIFVKAGLMKVLRSGVRGAEEDGGGSDGMRSPREVRSPHGIINTEIQPEMAGGGVTPDALVHMLDALLASPGVVSELMDSSPGVIGALVRAMTDPSRAGNVQPVLRILSTCCGSWRVAEPSLMQEPVLSLLMLKVKLLNDPETMATTHNVLMILDTLHHLQPLGQLLRDYSLLAKVIQHLWDQVRPLLSDPRYTPQFHGALRLLVEVLNGAMGRYVYPFKVPELKAIWWCLHQLSLTSPLACLLASPLWQLVLYAGKVDATKVKGMQDVGLWTLLTATLKHLVDPKMVLNMVECSAWPGPMPPISGTGIRLQLIPDVANVLALFEQMSSSSTVRQEMTKMTSTVMRLWRECNEKRGKEEEWQRGLYVCAAAARVCR